MKITLQAKSSSGEPYDVDFLFKNKALQVHCTCKAGIMRMVCKHRRSFLKGNQKMLADSAQTDDLATVAQWSEQVGFSTLIEQLDSAEAEVTSAQREVKKMKKRIEESMTHGLSRESAPPEDKTTEVKDG